jgi:anaerobic selenocysteine-containing dehydrogenase
MSMKIDRRSFLALSVGGAVGTALTPLPWKIQDDLSIWTQMWPWTPDPIDGENTYVNTVSTLCRGGCGVTVRKVGERAVKIDGREDYPTNQGGLCNLCASGLQMLYGPTRIPFPMKRVGERGANQWVRLSWEEAISMVAEQLGEIRQAGQPETVACLSDRKYGSMPALLKRFMTAFGSPNFMTTPTMMDAYDTTLKRMQGVEGRVGFDLENADYVLSFGSGMIEGWGNTAHMIRVFSKWKDTNTVIKQIEPRLSNTAAKSDQWIPITPGTEVILTLGIAYVIIKESLYDYDFVNNFATGFEQFRNVVLSGYSPGNVSKQTGVDQSTIVTLAREFARARRPIAICGRGQGTVPGGIGEYVAVHALNALVGNINRPGGVWAMPRPEMNGWSEPALDTAAQVGLMKPRLDGAGSASFPFAEQLFNRVPGALMEGHPYPCKALLVYDANPLFSMPGAETVREALQQIPFIVSFASHMDETAMMADVILPNRTHLERWEDVPATRGFNRPMIGMAQPVVDPQAGTMHAGDTVLQLAAALGGSVAASLPWENYEACLQDGLSAQWADLENKGFWIDEGYQPDTWSFAFPTASGKFDFAASEGDPKALFTPIQPDGDDGSYNLELIPYDSVRIANGPVGSPPFLIKIVSDKVLKDKTLFVEVNPETAHAAGFGEGDRAVLKTPLGSAAVRVHLADGIMPGLVAIPRGLGHTAYDSYLAEKGINANDLIGSVEDSASGLDAAWGIRASLVKA